MNNYAIFFQQLAECIVCLCDWHQGATLRGDYDYQNHLETALGINTWKEVTYVWVHYPYQNPFNWEF